MSLVWQTKRILNLICQYCQAKYTRTKGTHTQTDSLGQIHTITKRMRHNDEQARVLLYQFGLIKL